MHPIRMKILGVLVQKADTISAVARNLALHPANLTHHFRKLELAGLIRMIEKRSTGHNIEKIYESVAKTFEVHPGPSSIKNARWKVLKILEEDLNRGALQLGEKNNDPVIGLLVNVCIERKQFAEFAKRLKKLATEFEKIPAKDGNFYSLNLSLYPRRNP